jgi:hypothetical protein
MRDSGCGPQYQGLVKDVRPGSQPSAHLPGYSRRRQLIRTAAGQVRGLTRDRMRPGPILSHRHLPAPNLPNSPTKKKKQLTDERSNRRGSPRASRVPHA